MTWLRIILNEIADLRYYRQLLHERDNLIKFQKKQIKELNSITTQHEISLAHDTIYFFCHAEGVDAFKRGIARNKNKYQSIGDRLPAAAWDDGWCCAYGKEIINQKIIK